MEAGKMFAVRIIALLSLVALANCSDKQAEVEKPRPVRTLTVKSGDTSRTISQTGEVRPHVETDLGFRIDGRLLTRSVDIGSIIKNGDTLAVLDDRDVENSLSTAKAELTSAVTAAELAKINLDRQVSLFEKRVGAQARVDEAESNWRAAAARRDSASLAVEVAERKVGYTRLTADSSGIVTAVGANPSQVVAAGQMIVRIADTSETDAVFDVSERIVNTIPMSAKVRVSLISEPSVTVDGTVRDVSPVADPVTRSYRVRVALPNLPSGLTFGAAVNGQVELPEGDLFALPSAAMTSVDGKPAVYVVDHLGRKLLRKEVTVARYSDTEILVSSGLQNGDAVVVAGVSKLRPDQSVTIEGEK